MKVDLDELERVMRYLKEINNAPLSSIVWMRGIEVLQAPQEEMDEYEFTGLSNKDFPAVMGWMPDGVGIRVAVLELHKEQT